MSRTYPPPISVMNYWKHSPRPRPVYVVRAGHDSQQPCGYPLGWVTFRKQAEAFGRARGDGPHYLQHIAPGDMDAVWIVGVDDLEEVKL